MRRSWSKGANVADDKQWTLIIDPEVKDESRESLKAKCDEAQISFVETEDDIGDVGTQRERLRDVARDVENPLVILREYEDKNDFWRGAGFPMANLRSTPRGVVIKGYPDLLPLAPPPPLKLFDDKGRPLVPCAELTRRRKDKRGDNWDDGVADILERGGTPTFHISEAFHFLAAERFGLAPEKAGDLPAIGNLHEALNKSLGSRLNESFGSRLNEERLLIRLDPAMKWTMSSTFLWRANGPILVGGEHAPKLTGLFAEHHPDLGPDLFEIPDNGLRLFRQNPWRIEQNDDWPALARTWMEYAGISEKTLRKYLTDRLENTSIRDERDPIPCLMPRPLSWTLANGEESQRWRLRFEDLLCRSSNESEFLFLLELLAEARFAIGHHKGGGADVVDAEIGAGRIVRVWWASVDGVAGNIVTRRRWQDRADFDGGDVLLRFQERHSEILRSSARPARAPRSEDDGAQ